MTALLKNIARSNTACSFELNNITTIISSTSLRFCNPSTVYAHLIIHHHLIDYKCERNVCMYYACNSVMKERLNGSGQYLAQI